MTKSPIIIEEQPSTFIFLDYHYGTKIFLHPNYIIFWWNQYAHDCVLQYINRSVFDKITHQSIGYFQWKMKQAWLSKKDIAFYTWMLEHYIDNKI